MVDVDGDGYEDVVIAVSYFFDRTRSSRDAPEKLDGRPENYVASVLMV